MSDDPFSVAPLPAHTVMNVLESTLETINLGRTGRVRTIPSALVVVVGVYVCNIFNRILHFYAWFGDVCSFPFPL